MIIFQIPEAWKVLKLIQYQRSQCRFGPLHTCKFHDKYIAVEEMVKADIFLIYQFYTKHQIPNTCTVQYTYGLTHEDSSTFNIFQQYMHL